MVASKSQGTGSNVPYVPQAKQLVDEESIEVEWVISLFGIRNGIYTTQFFYSHSVFCTTHVWWWRKQPAKLSEFQVISDDRVQCCGILADITFRRLFLIPEILVSAARHIQLYAIAVVSYPSIGRCR